MRLLFRPPPLWRETDRLKLRFHVSSFRHLDLDSIKFPLCIPLFCFSLCFTAQNIEKAVLAAATEKRTKLVCACTRRQDFSSVQIRSVVHMCCRPRTQGTLVRHTLRAVCLHPWLTHGSHFRRLHRKTCSQSTHIRDESFSSHS